MSDRQLKKIVINGEEFWEETWPACGGGVRVRRTRRKPPSPEQEAITRKMIATLRAIEKLPRRKM